jgi:serine/threonine protein kinase
MEDFVDNLAIETQIGCGGFGKVMLALGEDGTPFAVKSIPNTSCQANIRREVKAGKKLQHKNISKFICHFSDDKNEHLVFDYIKGKPRKYCFPTF